LVWDHRIRLPKLLLTDVNLSFVWCPGNQGIQGNEEADKFYLVCHALGGTLGIQLESWTTEEAWTRRIQWCHGRAPFVGATFTSGKGKFFPPKSQIVPCQKSNITGKPLLQSPCWQTPPSEALLANPSFRGLAGKPLLQRPCWQTPPSEALLANPSFRGLAGKPLIQRPFRARCTLRLPGNTRCL
jgi:hypothetical protein